MRALKAIGLYALLGVVIPLAILEAALRLLPVSYPPHLLPVSAQDPVPRFQPNVEYVYSSGGDFAIRTRKRSNNFGYNHYADYRPQEKTPLLMVIGDSFVEAQAVGNGKSAAELLHAELGGRGRVYSIGVSGAPLSQYLVFAQYARATFRPDAMAFFIISNDFDESLMKYKFEPRFHYFDEKDGEVALRRVDYSLSPAKQLLRHSAFVRYMIFNLVIGTRIEALLEAGETSGFRDAEPPQARERRIADSERAVDYFLERLPGMSGLDAGSIVFVLDAVRPQIYSEAVEKAQSTYHGRMRSYFAAQAKARGYAVIDMQPVFIARHRRDHSRFEFPTDSHWNELGHKLVAGELAKLPLFERLFRDSALIRAGVR